MSLFERAARDFRRIVEGPAGFRRRIELTNPAGQTVTLFGLFNRVGSAIDPETAMLVQGQRASVCLSLRTLDELGVGQPKGVASKTSRPWVVEFEDVRGRSHRYKVTATMPDDTLGGIICELESYEA